MYGKKKINVYPSNKLIKKQVVRINEISFKKVISPYKVLLLQVIGAQMMVRILTGR